MTTTQQAVIDAEQKLKDAKTARDAEERESWRLKAKEFAREGRKALDAFKAAKADFARANAEAEQLARQAAQVEADLHELEVEYKLIEFPLASETEEYEAKRKKFLARVGALREALVDVARRKGVAIAAEVREGAKVEHLRFAHANATAKACGEKLGVIEGGVRFVS